MIGGIFVIVGIGVDIVETNRLKRWMDVKGLPERFFSSEELSYARAKNNSCHISLSAGFAAKEAFGKALGTGLAGIRLKDISVIRNADGKPELALVNTAKCAFELSGAKRIHLSLSHEKEYAAAIVILEN